MTTTPVRQALGGLGALVAWLDETPLTYEVIDGSIVVSPPPTSRHELVGFTLTARLLAACPEHLVVLPRYGWRYNRDQPDHFLEPDYAVVARDGLDLDASLHDQVPELVIETRSPDTWRRDEGEKKDIYAESGVASYWLLDPVTPRLRTLQLREGDYVETGVLETSGELTIERPFPVKLRLS